MIAGLGRRRAGRAGRRRRRRAAPPRSTVEARRSARSVRAAPAAGRAQLRPAARRRARPSRPATSTASRRSARSRAAAARRSRSSASAARRAEGGGQRLGVLGRDQQAVDAVLDHLGDAAGAGGDDRHPVGHRLQQRHRQPLRARGHHEDLGARAAARPSPPAPSQPAHSSPRLAGDQLGAARPAARPGPASVTRRPGSRAAPSASASSSTSPPLAGLAKPPR